MSEGEREIILSSVALGRARGCVCMCVCEREAPGMCVCVVCESRTCVGSPRARRCQEAGVCVLFLRVRERPCVYSCCLRHCRGEGVCER